MNATKLGLDRIEDIEVFVRIVESGSLTAAGVSLGMSTPLVSRRLATLERCLGVRLIDRSSRLLVLTEHGREFQARAELLLQHVRDAESALRAKPGELRGTMRISVPTAAVEMGLVGDFVALFGKHTNLSIEMQLSDRPVDVVGQGLDAALYLTDAPDRHPGDLILGQHPTSLAAATKYLERAGRPTSPDDLLHHRTIRAVSRRGTPLPWLLTHNDGRMVELPPAGSMFLGNDLRVTYNAITSGAGIGRMPLGYIAKGAESDQLEVVLPEWRFRPVMVAVTMRHRGARSSKIAELLELTALTMQRIDALAHSTPLESYYREQVALAALPSPPLSGAAPTVGPRE